MLLVDTSVLLTSVTAKLDRTASAAAAGLPGQARTLHAMARLLLLRCRGGALS